MDVPQTLENKRLNLRLEFEDQGDSTQVYVEHMVNEKTASYACAVWEGELTDSHGEYKLTKAQSEWLESEKVTDWLDAVGY